MKGHAVFKYDNMVLQFQTMAIIMFVDNVLYDKAAFYTNAEYETSSGIKWIYKVSWKLLNCTYLKNADQPTNS